jgi:hypothetical protein
MPQEIFQKLNAKLLSEKEEIRQALCKAYEAAPEPVDYQEKVYMFRDALEALRDPELDAETQNRLLKECVDRIEYYRERPQRIKDASGTTWSDPPIELNVKLRV